MLQGNCIIEVSKHQNTNVPALTFVPGQDSKMQVYTGISFL